MEHIGRILLMAYFIQHLHTHIGILRIETSSTHVLCVEFVDAPESLSTPPEWAPTCLDQTIIQLQEYFAGSRRVFDLPLWFSWTTFQQSVWHSLLEIPYGTTMSYAQQARQLLWDPKIVRASARANGQNEFAIVIPCHRVIAKSWELTGYKRWLDKKQWLLKYEQSKSFFWG